MYMFGISKPKKKLFVYLKYMNLNHTKFKSHFYIQVTVTHLNTHQFIYLSILCACARACEPARVCVRLCHSNCVEVRGQLEGSFLHHTGSGDETQVAGLVEGVFTSCQPLP